MLKSDSYYAATFQYVLHLNSHCSIVPITHIMLTQEVMILCEGLSTAVGVLT
jgi:hypothetical protein